MLDSWGDVSKEVTDMSFMFHSKSFASNASIEHWNVGTVTTMEGMFYHAAQFNQPLER